MSSRKMILWRRGITTVFLCSSLALAGCYIPPPAAYGPPPMPEAPPSGGPAQFYAAPGPQAYAAPTPALRAYARREHMPPPRVGMTRAKYIERIERKAARQGRDPQRAAVLAAQRFDAADLNHDGIIEPGEGPPPRAGGAAGRALQPPR